MDLPQGTRRDGVPDIAASAYCSIQIHRAQGTAGRDSSFRYRQTLEHRSAKVALARAAEMSNSRDQPRLDIAGATVARASQIGQRTTGVRVQHATAPELDPCDGAEPAASPFGHEHGFDAIDIGHV